MKLLLLVALLLAGYVYGFNTNRQERRGQERNGYNERDARSSPGDDSRSARAEMSVSPGCIEGDMLLTDQQQQDYLAMRELAAAKKDKRRVERNTNRGFTPWPNKTLVYEFEEGVGDTTKNLFRQAVEMYKTYTNILFTEADGSYTGSVTPLSVKQNGGGCFSTVGFVSGAKINFQAGACDYFGIMLHEIGHALGRFHEQTRTDRDDYLTVHWENIQSGYEQNFQTVDRVNAGPYDLQSIMHYSACAFSINGYAITLDPNYDNDVPKMGKQQTLSRLDAFTFSAMYDAFVDCQGSELWDKCKRGGVPYKDCQSCDCMPPFNGDNCDDFDIITECDEVHNSSLSGTITSPGYPGFYSGGSDCNYVIECPANYTIRMNFVTFYLEAYFCMYDKMEIKAGDLISELYPDEYCGDYLYGQVLTSFTHLTVLKFMSDPYYNYPGFEIEYECQANQ